MTGIVNTLNGSFAFIASNCPGFSDDNPADDAQLAAHTAVMNARAEALGIDTRYEVR